MNWNRPELAIPQDLAVLLDSRYFIPDGGTITDTETKPLSDINIGSVEEEETEAEIEPKIEPEEIENTDSINAPEPNEELVELLNIDVLDEDDVLQPNPEDMLTQDNTIDIPVDRSDILRLRVAHSLPAYPGGDNTPIISSEPEKRLPPNSPWAVCSPPAAETRTDRFLFRLMVEPSRRWTITLINTDTAERKNHASGSGGIPTMSGQIYTGLEFARLRGVV